MYPRYRRMIFFQFGGSLMAIPLSWKMECMSVTLASMHRKLRIKISPENLLARKHWRSMKKACYSRPIRIQEDQEKSDQYHRRLAYVFLKDGTFVNQEIVRNGLAHVLYKPPNTAYDAALLKSQQEAMKAGKGIWGNWKERATDYIGNRKVPTVSFEKLRFGAANIETKPDSVWPEMGRVLGRICALQKMYGPGANRRPGKLRRTENKRRNPSFSEKGDSA